MRKKLKSHVTCVAWEGSLFFFLTFDSLSQCLCKELASFYIILMILLCSVDSICWVETSKKVHQFFIKQFAIPDLSIELCLSNQIDLRKGLTVTKLLSIGPKTN